MNAKTWTPAVPRKAPDNIVSSSYTTTKVFVPSYEKERQPRIELLLANDYQRIWWQEKQIWDKKFADSLATKKILPRKLIKRKVPTCVTVKYPTRTERLREKKETKQKPIEKNPDVSSVKSEEHNEMKSDKEEARTEGYDEKSERGEEPEPEKHVETQLENPNDTKVEADEDTKVEADEDTKVETGEETKIENSN